MLYAGVVPHWVDQTSAFWYVRQTEKGKEYVKVDAASKKRTALFDQQKMAAALTEKAMAMLKTLPNPEFLMALTQSLLSRKH